MIPRIFLRFAMAFATVAAAAVLPPRAAAADEDKPQWYELRVYSAQSAEQQKRVNDYWHDAAVPAYNRMGIRPVGVFTEAADSPTNKIYVVIPCDSLEMFASIPAKLAADADYQKTAAEYLNSPKSNPAYERIESSLLVAFDGMKHISVPPPDKKPNVFELRTYMSPGENMGLNKIRMFESGEITLMRKVGLAPVFYGRTVVGAHMPCLTYLTCGENPEEHAKHWKGFSESPVWKGLQNDPQYKDNMIGIIKVILKRTSASQI